MIAIEYSEEYLRFVRFMFTCMHCTLRIYTHTQTHSLFVVRDDRDCRHQLLQRMLHAAAVAVVTKPLLLSLEMTFLKIAMHAVPKPCNIQIKVKLKLVKANGCIDTKHSSVWIARLSARERGWQAKKHGMHFYGE